MKTLLSTLFVITAAANMAVAGDKPDFSGKWKLDLEKSSFGAVPAPATMIRTVEQKGPDIAIDNALTGPDMNLSFQYSADGKETTNSFMGSDFKSKANWDGKMLVIRNYLPDGQLASTNKWTLSDDGKTFTDVWSISSPDGNVEVKYVLVKQ
jgi:hypothetical protein